MCNWDVLTVEGGVGQGGNGGGGSVVSPTAAQPSPQFYSSAPTSVEPQESPISKYGFIIRPILYSRL
jgi:hypothetical protein